MAGLMTGNGDSKKYRWCPHRDCYVALAVCEREAKKRKRCVKCRQIYQQLPLNFSFDKKQ